MVEIAALAQAVTVLLAPFLPQLIKLGEDVGEEVVKNTVDEGWNEAKALWAKLHPEIARSPVALDAAQEAARNPADADAVAALRLQIRKLMAADPALAEAVSKILEPSASAGATTVMASGHRSVAIGRDMNTSVIITGDENKLERQDPKDRPGA